MFQLHLKISVASNFALFTASFIKDEPLEVIKILSKMRLQVETLYILSSAKIPTLSIAFLNFTSTILTKQTLHQLG